MVADSLKKFVEAVLNENSHLPKKWYHGSKYFGIKSAKDYAGRYMFLTDSLYVAKEYTRDNPGLQAGLKPKIKNVELKPTIYEAILNFSDESVFDYRLSEHADLFRSLSRESMSEDPEGGFRKSDVSAVHAVPGSSISGVFPSWGIMQDLMPRLVQFGYLACFFAEGSQGASMCVVNPQYNVTIVNSIA